jgi:hypothetical protein
MENVFPGLSLSVVGQPGRDGFFSNADGVRQDALLPEYESN